MGLWLTGIGSRSTGVGVSLAGVDARLVGAISWSPGIGWWSIGVGSMSQGSCRLNPMIDGVRPNRGGRKRGWSYSFGSIFLSMLRRSLLAISEDEYLIFGRPRACHWCARFLC